MKIAKFPLEHLKKPSIPFDADKWNECQENIAFESRLALPREYQLLPGFVSNRWTARQIHKCLEDKFVYTDGQATSLITTNSHSSAVFLFAAPSALRDEYQKHRCTVTIVTSASHTNEGTEKEVEKPKKLYFVAYSKNKHGAFVAVGEILKLILQSTDTKFESIHINGCVRKEVLPIPPFVLRDFCSIRDRVDVIMISNGKLSPEQCRALVGTDACAAKSLVLKDVFVDPAFFGEVCQNKHYTSIDLGELTKALRKEMLEEIEMQNEMSQFPGYHPPPPPPTFFAHRNYSITKLFIDGPHLKFAQAFANVKRLHLYRPYDLKVGDFNRVHWRRLRGIGPVVHLETLHPLKTEEWYNMAYHLPRCLSKAVLKFSNSLSSDFSGHIAHDCPSLVEIKADFRVCDMYSWGHLWIGLTKLRSLKVVEVTSQSFDTYDEDDHEEQDYYSSDDEAKDEDDETKDGDEGAKGEVSNDKVEREDRISATVLKFVDNRASVEELKVSGRKRSTNDDLVSPGFMKKLQKRLAVRRAIRKSPLLLETIEGTPSRSPNPKLVPAMLLRSILTAKNDSSNEAVADSWYRLLTANTDCLLAANTDKPIDELSSSSLDCNIDKHVEGPHPNSKDTPVSTPDDLVEATNNREVST